MAAHRQQQQHDDDDASVSPMPPARRQRVGNPHAPRMPSLTTVDLSQLQARLDGLEELLVERVLPILDRLDDRLAATAPNNDEELPASQDSLAELVRAPTLAQTNARAQTLPTFIWRIICFWSRTAQAFGVPSPVS